tara:strand:- start:50 stop:283 length:234 start_codon:yes stop_codon:yes gene_type:complete
MTSIVTLRNEVIYGLIAQLEDGQILNYMSDLPVDRLIHLAAILREMHFETQEVRYQNLTEAVMQVLHGLGITLADDI